MTGSRDLRTAVLSLLVSFLALAASLFPALPAAAQSAPETALPPSVPHTVLPAETSITLRWQTETPARGTVFYGLAPGALTNIAFEAPEPRTDHSITISGLEPATQLYYLIGSGTAPVGKNGQPFVASTNPVAEAADVVTDAAAASPAPFVQPGWGVSFLPPAGWASAPIPLDQGDETIPQWVGGPASISVDRLANPGALSPEAWFAAHRADFDATLAQPAGSFTVDGAPALMVAQPDTCRSAPTLVALIAHAGFMFQVLLADNGGRASAPELAALLGSWRFGAAPGAGALAESLVRFPEPPQGIDCTPPVLPAGVAVAPLKCAGAGMTIPTAGPDIQPWGCYGSKVFEDRCWPYDAASPRGSYFRLPHRGVDLGGDPGVSPVYATYSGRVYKYRDNNILLQFSGPYAGKSAWMAHMASFDGKIDYRMVTNGQLVTEGQFIGYVGYRITDGPPHLHISYLMNSGGSEGWPSIDPTRMLAARNIVWHDGWDFAQPLECSAGSADSFEPDHFVNLASVAATDGTPQRHDFHAQGDEDLVRFAAVAGKSYLIETFDLESGNDTQIAVLNSTGYTVLAENDDIAPGNFASSLLFTPTYSGNFLVRVRHYSFRGYLPFRPQPTFTFPVYGPGTGYSLSVEEVLPNVLWGRLALATSYDAAAGEKANYAIDGDTGTRWSSQPGTTSTQWWWAETGNRYYNTVTIRWDQEYAARYFVGWSTNNITYSGYYFTVSGPGWYAHDLAALRSSKYVAVRMEQLAPGEDQYAMSEVAAYRRFGPLVASDPAAGEQPIELAPDGDLVTILLDGETVSNVYLPAVGR